MCDFHSFMKNRDFESNFFEEVRLFYVRNKYMVHYASLLADFIEISRGLQIFCGSFFRFTENKAKSTLREKFFNKPIDNIESR